MASAQPQLLFEELPDLELLVTSTDTNRGDLRLLGEVTGDDYTCAIRADRSVASGATV